MNQSANRSLAGSIANLGDIQEEFLLCPLCSEDYNDPRSLPCLHSFCFDCISEHIVESTNTQTIPKSFLCPLCKKQVDGHINLSIEKWADNLPSNSLLLGLLEAAKLRTEDKQCDTCLRRERKSSAIFWCDHCGEALCKDCNDVHKNMKFTKWHKVLDIDTIRQLPFKTTLIRKPCPLHTGEYLDFFCDDHSSMLCPTCVTIYHRECASVKSFKDAATVYRKETESLIENLKQQKDWSIRIIENRKHCITMLEGAATQVKSQITNIRRQISDAIDVQEKRIIEELEEMKNVETEILQFETETCQDIISRTSNSVDLLNNTQKHGTDNDLLSCIVQIKRETRLSEKTLKNMTDHLKDVHVDFKSDNNLPAFLNHLKELGSFSVSRHTVLIPPSYAVRADTVLVTEVKEEIEDEPGLVEKEYDDTGTESSAQPFTDFKNFVLPPIMKNSAFSPPLKTVSTNTGVKSKPPVCANLATLEISFRGQTPNDRENCNITGAEFIGNGRIVLVDQVQRKIKLFDHQNKFITEKILSARPFDVASVSATDIAVTLPKEKRILLLAVRESDFSVTGGFQTGAKCFGIAYSQDKFAICCYSSPPCIKVMSRDGRELKVLSKDQLGQDLFFFPEYIAADKDDGNIYITDKYKKSVLSLTRKGDKRWEIKYHYLKSPRGIAVHGTRVFVAGSRSHNIIETSTEGEIIGNIVIDGILSPQKICTSPGGNKFMVTQYHMTLMKVDKNTVKIFNVPKRRT